MDKAMLVLVEWREYKRAENYSLGLNYIHAAVAHAGYTVETMICDGWDAEKVCGMILQYNPDIVGLKLYAETAHMVFQISALLKQKAKEVLIAVGGHTATLHGNLILRQEPSIDLVSNGEGEKTFVKLCELIKTSRPISECKGISFRLKSGEIQTNTDRNYTEHLDDLVLPVSSVFSEGNDTSEYMTYAISTSRGCVGNCYFCVANHVYEVNGEKRWRGMSPEKISGEIKKVCDENPEKKIYIKFLDSSLENPDPLTKKRLWEIVSGLEKLNRNIKFSFFTRSESWQKKDAELICRMKKAGLYRVYIGYDESIQPYPIREFTKKIISKDNIASYKMFRDNGIETTGYLIIFQPFVTLDQLLALAEFIDEIGMSYSPDTWSGEVTLFSDTSLFHDVVAAGLLLGVSGDGYTYNYLYEDESVSSLKEQICKIKDLESYNSIRNTILKVEMELERLALAGLKDDKKRLFDAFKKEIKAEYAVLGNRQKKLFIESVNHAKRSSSEMSYVRIVKEWDALMSEIGKKLESIWFKNRVRFIREGYK